jgi:N-methylhydantoinase A
MLLEGRWSTVGMVTTAGFRDVIELNRQVRAEPFDLFFERPLALVPRHLRRGALERIAADGTVLQPLDEEAATAELADLVTRHRIEALVVCFVNSYANPAHELRMVALAARDWPDLPVVASAQLLPRRGEFERFMTASVNAATLPRFQAYVERLERAVQDDGPGGQLYLMQSTGRLATAKHARTRSVDYCESGPAAGVVGGVTLASDEQDVTDSLLTLDVGGTTAKVATTTGGQIDVTSSYSVGGAIHGRAIGAASSGYTVAVPVLDMVEIGAGGGSIVWCDAGGAMRVGPQSAGADPGPVCYGRGGSAATLTDALVVSGVLSGEQLLGGGLSLDRAAAVTALAEVGALFGEDAIGAAVGAVQVAATGMRAAVRTVTVERGYDPADFALFACGGLGPTFAGLLAPELGVSTVLVPEHAGVFSAWGLTLAPLGSTLSASLPPRPAEAPWATLRRELEALTEAVEQSTAAMNSGAAGDCEIKRYVEMRYPGQSSTIDVDISGQSEDADFTGWLQSEFARSHEARFGFRRWNSDGEFVGIRVSGSLPPRVVRRPGSTAGPREDAPSRAVHVFEGAPRATVFRQQREGTVEPTPGPLIIERYDSTVLVPPGWIAASLGPFLRLSRDG